MIWDVKDLFMHSCEHIVFLEDEWRPAKPLNSGYAPWSRRVYAAFMVLIGKADAFRW